MASDRFQRRIDRLFFMKVICDFPPQFSFNGSEGRGCMFIADWLEGINFVE